MTGETEALIDAAEDLLRRVAPHETAGRPLYVVPVSAVPGAASTSTAGWFCRSNDLIYRGAIGERWRGRGLCIVIDDTLGQEWADSFALHEFAHALEIGYDPADHPERTLPAGLTPAAAAEDAVRGLAFPSPAAEQVATHGPHFCRVLCHLLFREELLARRSDRGGVMLGAFGYPWLLAVGERLYGLLFGEYYRHVDRPLAALTLTPPPPEFVVTWENAAASLLSASKPG